MSLHVPRFSAYLYVQLKRQVLFAMGIDVVTHVPAQDLAGVMPLFANTAKHGSSSIKPQVLGNGPGLIRLNFSKACMSGGCFCFRPRDFSARCRLHVS